MLERRRAQRDPLSLLPAAGTAHPPWHSLAPPEANEGRVARPLPSRAGAWPTSRRRRSADAVGLSPNPGGDQAAPGRRRLSRDLERGARAHSLPLRRLVHIGPLDPKGIFHCTQDPVGPRTVTTLQTHHQLPKAATDQGSVHPARELLLWRGCPVTRVRADGARLLQWTGTALRPWDEGLPSA